MDEVEVVKFYPFELPGRKGGLIGYADVKLGEHLIIRGVKLMKNKHGGYYVQLPSVQSGGKSYPIVEVTSRELLDTIRRKVKDSYEKSITI